MISHIISGGSVTGKHVAVRLFEWRQVVGRCWFGPAREAEVEGKEDEIWAFGDFRAALRFLESEFQKNRKLIIILFRFCSIFRILFISIKVINLEDSNLHRLFPRHKFAWFIQTQDGVLQSNVENVHFGVVELLP